MVEMANELILVVDDDPVVRDLLNEALLQNGFSMIAASSTAEGIDLANRRQPRLIILDLRMPGTSGLEALRLLRQNSVTEAIPVIILTAEKSEPERVAGLEAGADDFVLKPFSIRELIARIRSVLRRSKRTETAPTRLTIGSFTLDTAKHLFMYADQSIPFTATEFRIVELLARDAGNVLSRGQLSHIVRDIDPDPNDRAIDAHIKSIRRKLGDGAAVIQTVRGFGYKFSTEDVPLRSPG